MATLVANPSMQTLQKRLLWRLEPLHGQTALIIRIALICTFSVLITSTYGLPEAAISAYAVFFMVRSDRVSSIAIAVVMMLVISLMVGLIFLTAIVTLDYSALRILAMTVLSASLLFLASASKLSTLAAMLAMITGFGLGELGIVPTGEVATRALLYIWLACLIPTVATIAISLVLAPSPRQLLCQQLAKSLRAAAQRIQNPDADTTAITHDLRAGDKSLLTWLKLSVIEGTTRSEDVPALTQAISSTMVILTAAEFAGRDSETRLPREYAERIIMTLEQMAVAFDQGGYPVAIELDLPTGHLTPLASAVATCIHNAITHFAEGNEVPANNKSADHPTHQKSKDQQGGFLLPDAWTNVEHVRYALKTTMAAMSCYLLYMLINWPGIHTCFITCYIVSLGTLAETVEKLSLRIVGCLIGAVLGTAAIVFIIPTLTSITGLLLLVFAGSCFSAWVAFGLPRISYMGFQIAFAFFLCVLQDGGLGFDLTIARDRIIGILLGNLVVYLMFTNIWPVSIAKRVHTGIKSLVKQWEKLASIHNVMTRRSLAAQAMAQCQVLTQELRLMRYEPASIRPRAASMIAHDHLLMTLSEIDGALFLMTEYASCTTNTDISTDITARLHQLATINMSPLAQPSLTHPNHNTTEYNALLDFIDQRLATAQGNLHE